MKKGKAEIHTSRSITTELANMCFNTENPTIGSAILAAEELNADYSSFSGLGYQASILVLKERPEMDLDLLLLQLTAMLEAEKYDKPTLKYISFGESIEKKISIPHGVSIHEVKKLNSKWWIILTAGLISNYVATLVDAYYWDKI